MRARGAPSFIAVDSRAEGELVSAHYNRTARLAGGGDYDNEYNMLFRLEAGRIAEVWEVADTAYAFGGSR